MRRTPEVWDAARLLGFANLTVTARNWRSLWDVPASARARARVGPITADVHSLVMRSRAWSTSRRRVLASLMEGGELWRAFAAEVIRYGEPPCPGEPDWNVFLGIQDLRRGKWQPVALAPASPLAPLPRKGEFGRRMSYAGLAALQKKTRNQLERICTQTAAASRTVVRQIGDYQPPGNRLLPVLAPPGKRSASPQFLFVPERREPHPTLRRHLNGLFVRTAGAGLWQRFARCPVCGRFALRLIPQWRACSGPCRAKLWRAVKKEVKEEWKQRVRGRYRELVEARVSADTVQARLRDEFHLTPRRLSKLLG